MNSEHGVQKDITLPRNQKPYKKNSMKEVRKIAAEYAVAQTNEVMSLAIAKAYADGYRDGYRDKEEEIPVDMHANITEFVDLGLPSGTLWAADYERINGNEAIEYLPYEKVSQMNIPTREQWEELLDICRWNYKYVSSKTMYFICIGPNGNTITFPCYGSILNGESTTDHTYAMFWIHDEGEELEKNAVHMHYHSRQQKEVVKTYKGYKLPVRLVR